MFHLSSLQTKNAPGVPRSILYSYVLAAGITAAATVAATAATPTAVTAAAVAAAHPNDNQQDDNPAAVTSTKAVIAHKGPSHEVLTDESVSTHHMQPLAMRSCLSFSNCLPCLGLQTTQHL